MAGRGPDRDAGRRDAGRRDAARRAAPRRPWAQAAIPAPRGAEPEAGPASAAPPAGGDAVEPTGAVVQPAKAVQAAKTLKYLKPAESAEPAEPVGAAEPVVSPASASSASSGLGGSVVAGPNGSAGTTGSPDASLPVDRPPASEVRAGWHLAPGESTLAEAVPAAAGGVAALAGAAYLGWRGSHLGGTGLTGAVAFTAELAAYLALVALAAQAARVNRRFVRRAPGPAGTLDVFVIARGEPLADVDRALRSARDLDYPHHTYLVADTRVDEAGGRGGVQALEALAERLDVSCLWRADGPPSRAGLLNAALARTDGDAVLLLDAGDVLATGAAHQILGYLRDPQVGLVASGWRVAAGPGPLPDRAEPAVARLLAAARDRDGAAVGAGSGTLYRRSALETVDGFSARGGTEEPRTSYELHAAGWESVHHPEVLLTRAARPAVTAARLGVVRAADRLRVLLFDNPLLKQGLDRRQRAHYLWDAAAPVLAAAQAGVWLAPMLVILGGGRLGNGSATGWFGFGLPFVVTAALFVLTVTGMGGTGAKGAMVALVGWLVSIPLSLLAVVRVAFIGGRTGADTAPDIAPAALRTAPAPAAPTAAPTAAPSARRELLPASPARSPVTTRPAASRRRPGRFPWSRWAGWGAAAARLAVAGWTPLLPLSLGAGGLAVCVVAAALRPDRAVLAVVVWAGAILLAVAEPAAAACGIPWDTPTARRRLRATITSLALLAALVTLVLG